jgi:hypothetical protein
VSAAFLLFLWKIAAVIDIKMTLLPGRMSRANQGNGADFIADPVCCL